MAHFAELDNNNVVLRVVVVGNDCVPSDEHVDGETWCINFFGGGTWKQTSYNNNFRKQYCGTGYTYDAAKNKFISPQTYASWALDADDNWQSPVAYPTTTTYENGVYTQADVDADVYPPEHAQAGQRRNTFAVGDTKQSTYYIIWDEENLKWKSFNHLNEEFNWDASALAWVSV